MKHTVKEIIDFVQNLPRNDDYVHHDLIGELFPCVYDKKNDRITNVSVDTWVCTDTLVGVFLYYFDGVPICFSVQTGRKMDKEFLWIRKDMIDQVKEYLRSFTIEDLYMPVCVDQDTIFDINLKQGE